MPEPIGDGENILPEIIPIPQNLILLKIEIETILRDKFPDIKIFPIERKEIKQIALTLSWEIDGHTYAFGELDFVWDAEIELGKTKLIEKIVHNIEQHQLGGVIHARTDG